ncbi:TPA: hypothetical protein U1137_000015 [Streptococcus suis]|nr:hypothetical protein [Streptococcus suis]HEM4810069.1 hypothetical protein [Streptococcus suis]HEM4837660.1 hypothetical protein [Streptococcus suis]HEM4860825.1 hypothetical protein [Streptococcus suis]HEM4889412.1 hypothetical protein [Streptococcus suis]
MESINKMVEAFGKDKLATKKEFISLKENSVKQLQGGYVGETGYRKIISLKLEDLEKRNQTKTNDIIAAMAKVFTAELDKLNSMEQQVTADDLAEITLLSEMDLTEEEFRFYFYKYQNKPIVLKKIRQIYKQGSYYFAFPLSKKEILEQWESEMTTAVNYINTTVDYMKSSANDLMVDEIVINAYIKELERLVTDFSHK